MKFSISHPYVRMHGSASLLAMLFLVLFSTLALGFYALTNTAIQASAADAKINRALLAADSGMDFMRYQLDNVSIPPSTASANIINELFNDLQYQMEATGNLGTQSVVMTGNTIKIPGDSNGSINLASNGDSCFRATITDWAGEIVVKIDGMAQPANLVKDGKAVPLTRTITMDFSRKQRRTTVFNYAVASKGQIITRKGAVTSVAGVDPAIATMMSASDTTGAVTVTGGIVGGDLNHVVGGSVNVTGGTVAGSSIISNIMANHVHEVDEPEFPTIDTSIYRQYATNVYSNKKTQQNIRIPANTNPQFNGGDSVQGIMYIESPNTVTFRGNFNLQGFIIFENSGDESANILDFRGNVSQQPLPSGSQFDALRSTTGISILAPTANVTMSGSTDSFLRGNVMVGKFNFNGSADIQIDRGTLMTFNEGTQAVNFNGKTVKFTATGTDNMPTSGVSYSSNFQPDPASYMEISP